MSRRRQKSRTSRRKKRTRKNHRSWLPKLVALSFLLALAASIYLLYLDHQVRTKFEGKRWAVPARVYARSLDLYPGAPVARNQLENELDRLGYRRVIVPTEDATWSQSGDSLMINTRPFWFWDGEEKARRLVVRFSNGHIRTLQDGSGRPVSLVRLEPPEIGSIYPAHNEDRVLIKREELPETLVTALIEVEDRSFFSHFGVDPKGILRAMWNNLWAGRVVEGGSTLTQQLVKNFYLTSERSLWRKVNEAAMAILLELHFSKDEILEGYANEINLGQDGSRAVHGFGLASHFFFNRPLQELELSQQALLVALANGPSLYNPLRNPKQALERRNRILRILQERGYIDTQQAEEAIGSALGVAKAEQRSGGYPAFLDLVRRQLHRDYREEDLTSEGLKVFTTFDPWVQLQAEQALRERLTLIEKRKNLPDNQLEAAVVVAGSENGEVLAVVGGRKPRFAGFNRALDAIRPIGSLVKPAVYLSALMQPARFSLVSVLDDSKITLTGRDGQQWTPANYDKKEHGRVRLHTALTHSYNLATVRLGTEIGLDRVIATLRSLGISRPIQHFPSLLLGAVALSPMEVAQLYQTLAAGGFYSPLRAIRAVQAADGEALQRYPLTVNQEIPPEPVYLINSNLQEVVRNGTGRGLASYLPPATNVAGKTGTTDDLRDSWFAGFSGDKVAVVWVGRDDNKPAKLTGSSGALPVWGTMMRRLRPQPLELIRPDRIETVWIDLATGLRGSERCSSAQQYPFIIGSGPNEPAPCAQERRSPNIFDWFFR